MACCCNRLYWTVPGAFMTMIVSTNLKRIIREQTINSPVEILTQLNFLVKNSLQQDTEYAEPTMVLI